MLKEIQKCEVRYGSCHRRVTHQRANSLRYKISKGLWIEELGLFATIEGVSIEPRVAGE